MLTGGRAAATGNTGACSRDAVAFAKHVEPQHSVL